MFFFSFLFSGKILCSLSSNEWHWEKTNLFRWIFLENECVTKSPNLNLLRRTKFQLHKTSAEFHTRFFVRPFVCFNMNCTHQSAWKTRFIRSIGLTTISRRKWLKLLDKNWLCSKCEKRLIALTSTSFGNRLFATEHKQTHARAHSHEPNELFSPSPLFDVTHSLSAITLN